MPPKKSNGVGLMDLLKIGPHFIRDTVRDVKEVGKDVAGLASMVVEPGPQPLFFKPEKFNHEDDYELLTQVCICLQYTRLAFGGKDQILECELLRMIGLPMYYFDDLFDRAVDKWKSGKKYMGWAEDLKDFPHFETAYSKRKVLCDLNPPSGANLVVFEDEVWYGKDSDVPIDGKWTGNHSKPCKVLIVGSKGTDEFYDHLQDLKTWPHVPQLLVSAIKDEHPKYPERARVVKGFYQGFAGSRSHPGCSKELADVVFGWIKEQEEAKKGYKVFITGHSFGAGVATAAFSYLMLLGLKDATLITFGSPRLCNEWHAVWQAELLKQTGCMHLNVFVGGDLATYWPFRYPVIHAGPHGWMRTRHGRPVQQGWPVEVDEWMAMLIRLGKRFNYEGEELCHEILDETKAYGLGGGKHMYYMGLNLMNVRWSGLGMKIRPANNFIFETKKRRDKARRKLKKEDLHKWWPGIWPEDKLPNVCLNSMAGAQFREGYDPSKYSDSRNRSK